MALGASLAISLLPLAAHAQAPFDAEVRAAAEALPDDVRRQIEAGPDRYLARVMNHFRRYTASDAVTEEAIRRTEAAWRAEDRAGALARLMRRDLDGDGRVSRAEYAEGGGDHAARVSEEFARLIARADRDGDGAIGLGEMLSALRTEEADEGGGSAGRRGAPDLRLFDANRDGTISAAEIRSVIAAVAPPAPLARPTPVPVAQPRQTRPAAAPPPVPNSTRSCDVPSLPEGAEVVYLSGHLGVGMSSVAIDGMDTLTSVATVEIEAGERPLYVFASAARPTIWRVGGATGRVARFVVEPQNPVLGPGAGVAGLPRDAVTFLPAGSCAESVAWPGSARAKGVARRLAWGLGVALGDIRIVALSRLDRVRIPSGEAQARVAAPPTGPLAVRDGAVVMGGGASFGGSLAARGRDEPPTKPRGLPNSRRVPDAPTPRERAPRQWKRTARGRLEARLHALFPDGLVALEPAAIVAAGPVVPYDVLPGHAGMIQLLDAGAMREVSPGMYLLTRAVPRFPADLQEAPAVRIVLDEGVPIPAGRPGHTRVFRREVPKCLLGPDCG